MLKGVHHINFLVADLESAIERYQDFFGSAV
jgi:catechol 2,3-dioxygenase-like lactoylglutathione lyase family enzyme